MISNEHVSCIAPATETASFQILFNCPTPAIVLEIIENPHVLLTFDKVHNPLRRPRKTTSERPKVLRPLKFLTLWLRNVLRATRACTFSTSHLPKVLRPWCVLYILTWKCASCHNGVQIFDNLQKCSDRDVLCTFRLGNVLCPTMACTFSTSQLPKVVRAWCVLYILTWKRVSCHKGVQFFISHLATWLRTRHFSEPNFSTLRSHKSSANTVFRDFATFSRTWIFFLLRLSRLLSSFFLLSSSLLFSDSSHLCFSSVHTVRSLTSKLPSIRHSRKTNNSQKRRSWGAGFCTWMFQYIWVVILISNALLFNGNDWFKAFVWPLCPWPASPYHLLHSFMQPIMPTTILVLGHIEKSKQILENKKTQAKPKN